MTTKSKKRVRERDVIRLFVHRTRYEKIGLSKWTSQRENNGFIKQTRRGDIRAWSHMPTTYLADQNTGKDGQLTN